MLLGIDDKMSEQETPPRNPFIHIGNMYLCRDCKSPSIWGNRKRHEKTKKHLANIGNVENWAATEEWARHDKRIKNLPEEEKEQAMKELFTYPA